MNYQEAMDYLKNLTTFGINLGLGRMEELLVRLDNPEKKLTAVHVGGTNGKGSVSAMLATILEASGMVVGLFTSPHIHAYPERIKINGQEIKEEVVANLIAEMRVHLDQMVAEGFEHPTEFEVSTALSFLYFARQQVDIAVIEVGLGGEIDSTNVILPRLSIITNIGMDHMDYLGSTIEDIARVKSGIIKAGKDVITATDEPRALAIIREKAAKEGAAVWEYHRDLKAEPLTQGFDEQVFNCQVQGILFRGLKIRLLGAHQLKNAALAVAAAVKLGISATAIRQGLIRTIWPCRLEVMGQNPLIVIDAAHNHHGIMVLVQALKDYWPHKKKVLLLGMLADKEREKVIAEIAPLVEKVVVTKPNSPRVGQWQEVADFVRNYVEEVYVEENIIQAVDKALNLIKSGEMLLITGSIYMVAEARTHLNYKNMIYLSKASVGN